MSSRAPVGLPSRTGAGTGTGTGTGTDTGTGTGPELMLKSIGSYSMGPSVFDLPVSTPPPAPRRGGVGPPVQKTKTEPFLTVTTPLQHARVRRRRNFCGGNPQNDVFTIVSGFSSICQDTSEDPSSGFWFWTQLCQFRDQDPNFFLYGDGF